MVEPVQSSHPSEGGPVRPPRLDSRSDAWPLWAGLTLVLTVGIVKSLGHSLWFDEACTMFTTSDSARAALRRAIDFEQQPPLYFLLAWSVRVLHRSVEAVRLLSTLFALGTVWVCSRIAALTSPPGERGRLALLAAVTPHLLWAASEARPYALAVLLIAGSTWLFLRLLRQDPPASPWVLRWYVAISAAAVFTFYYTAFVLMAQGLVGLASPARRRLWRGWMVMAAVFIAWSPVLVHQFAGRQRYLPALAGFGNLLQDPGAALALLMWAGRSVLLALFRLTPMVGARTGLLATGGVLVLLLLIRLLPARLRWSTHERQMLTLAGVPVLILLILRATNVSLVEPRHWIITIPGLLLLLDATLNGIASRGRRMLASGLVLSFFLLGSASYTRNYRGQADWRGAAGFLASRAAPEEPLIFFATDGALPLAYYFQGENAVFQIPEPDKKRSWDEVVLTGKDQRNAREALALARGAGSFWLLEKLSIPPDSSLRTIGRFTSQPLIVTDSAEFFPIRMRRIRLVPTDSGQPER